MPRIKKFGKNKFKGNQFTSGGFPFSITPDKNGSLASSGSKHRPNLSLEGSSTSLDDRSTTELNISASERKLKFLKMCGEDNEYLPEKNTKGNFIIDLEILNKNLLNSVKCAECDGTNSIEICEVPSNRKGLAVQFILLCKNCKFEKCFYSSKKTESNVYDINIRCVYGHRSIGKGKAAAEVMCAVMDLPTPPSRFQKYNEIISKSVESVAEDFMIEAAYEAVIENDGSSDIAAAFDGTWQKRGHTSINGVFTVTSIDTGKVLDAVCLSKYCSCSNKKKATVEHSEKCSKNYEGSSGGMEVAAAKEVFQRSKIRGVVRYVKYLGDGDSNAFSSVIADKPYEDVEISKLECVGHIQKRMGSRLRRLKNKMRGIKLSDGKPLSGRGRLTDAVIDSFQVYYGKAIRDNLDDVEKMRTAVWATYFHKLSSDDKPQHSLCPKGETSWCKYQKSLITGEKYTHKNSVPEAVMSTIKPIFQDLTDKNLLEKCTHGRTQNPNEALNNVIWTRISKNNFVTLPTLRVGVMDAIITFNYGALGKVRVLESLCGDAGRNCVVGLKHIDKIRILEANRAIYDTTKNTRKEKRNLKRKKDEICEEKCNDYGAGNF